MSLLRRAAGSGEPRCRRADAALPRHRRRRTTCSPSCRRCSRRAIRRSCATWARSCRAARPHGDMVPRMFPRMPRRSRGSSRPATWAMRAGPPAASRSRSAPSAASAARAATKTCSRPTRAPRRWPWRSACGRASCARCAIATGSGWVSARLDSGRDGIRILQAVPLEGARARLIVGDRLLEENRVDRHRGRFILVAGSMRKAWTFCFGNSTVSSSFL